MGRKLSDGCLVHLGWKDFQVNIRGHRIEVTEVETALLGHPNVKEVAVVGREHWSGETRLVAALVPREKKGFSADDLQGFLKNRLPDYMIPSAFMLLNALPLGPNGKINRRALPTPDWLPLQRSANYVAARTELEELIIAIWKETLGLDVVGVHDNFFDLGGHSLLLGQVVSKVQTAFKLNLPLNALLEQPTVSNLAQIIEGSLRNESEFVKPIASVSRPPSLPLSFAQERLWFLDQLEPDTAAYNVPTATLIEGQLDVDAMEKALNEVAKRHEALRTTFTVTDGTPAQVILPEVRLTLPVVNLSHLSETESEAETHRLITEYAQRPFDLSEAPLLRALLLKLSHNKHVFLTIHHLIADAWSIGILFDELSIFYDMYSAGKSSELPELPVQYADFAVWQRQWLQGKALESQISYWKQQLGDNLSVVELPTDHPRPVRQTFRGARRVIVLPEFLTAAIKDLSRRESVTLFMTLLAAFKTLLYRYSGQEAIVVGSPIAGRNRAEVENLIGLFVNTLVLRTDFSGNPSFRELLRRVRTVCLGAYAHQDLPFEKLVEELQPERDLSRNPLFQVMFVLQSTPVSVINFTGLTARRFEVDSGTAKFDLTVSLAEQGNELVGCFEYSTDLFDSSMIERMVGHFQTLLEGIIGDPDQPIATSPLLAEAERHKVLMRWNDTKAEYPKELCIHELFEAQVERTPEAIAVEFEGENLTYRELNTRANRLAHHFQSLGVGPKKLVGICVERSLEMLVGLLGILKAGGAYVPLEPAYPGERLDFMIRDAQVSVIVTQARFAEDRRWRMEDGDPQSPILDPRLPVVCLDRDWKEFVRQSDKNPRRRAHPDSLAYVIYTSGSTGQPKGVQIEHQSLVNCLYSIRRQVGLAEQDVLLAVTTISFDIAALELYLPLITGARVVVASRDDVQDGKRLLGRLTECGTTAMQATPSSWTLLLDAGWRGSESFKILCGGEALSRKLADQLLEGGAALWNLYGPTETTIWSTMTRVEADANPVPVGRPIANTQTYILDSHLQPVLVGVHGELYIGGDGLTPGYLNHPELTAERFVRNPFSDQPGSRLYRTGDLARFRNDGDIEFLGRVDNQLKVRGYRVELGEIEAILNQHVAVKECVVVARERESSEEKELVGYIVPNQDSVASVSNLRSLLRQKLPDYMIPSVFVFLNALPLTPNGKVDRSKLPPPGYSRPSLDQGFVEPRSEIEELVAQVWREVLKLDKIGVYDNFFELGGHSLLATRAVVRLRNNFNVDLPLRKLFELPTVAVLAEYVDFLRRNQIGVTVPPIVHASREQPIPLSFSQRRLWFLHKLDRDLTAYNMAAIFHLKGRLNITALEFGLNEMITRHEVLRTRITERDGCPFQEVVPSARLMLPIIDLSLLSEDLAAAEVQHLSSSDASQTYDIENPSLMRAKVLRLNDERYVLIFNFHHMIFDGTSIAVFYQELAQQYEAFQEGRALLLPPLPVQYADYAIWQSECLQVGVLKPQLEYWKRQLGAGFSPVDLPTDFERPPVQSFRGARLSKVLSDDLTRSLKGLNRQEDVTLFMVLLAAWNVLLSRYSGHEDIVVGSTIAGRNQSQIENLIGLFVNTLVLRTDLSGNPTFRQLLTRVKEMCLQAYTHQDLPFEKLVEELQPERDLSRNPLFNVMFIFQNTESPQLHIPGLVANRDQSYGASAKFDLLVSVSEQNQKLVAMVEYSTDLFTESTIDRMIGHFIVLLRGIVADPDQRISNLPLLPESERHQLLAEWNATNLEYAKNKYLHELFEAQVELSPHSVALEFGERNLTYRELNGRANQVAHLLRKLGVGPEKLVGICMERSLEMAIGLLGIFKAGGAYVPLDPTYPRERLEFMIADSSLTVLLTRGNLAHDLLQKRGSKKRTSNSRDPEVRADISIVCLDDSWDSFAAESQENLHSETSSENPAYVIYTSGSTGSPKGVVGLHRSTVNRLNWMWNNYPFRGDEKSCVKTSLSFVDSVWEIFGPLLRGVPSVIIPEDIVKDPELLIRRLARNRVTRIVLVPSLLKAILDVDPALQVHLSDLKVWVSSGELLPREVVEKFYQRMPEAVLLNLYGSSEVSADVTYFDTRKRKPAGRIPIGRPISNTWIYILDSQMQLVPIGVPGEIYIGGDGLCRGYLNRPELNVEKFTTNPFQSGDRLFKTGDYGRYLKDGNIEFLGRLDHQVKIRGNRIELGEIETALHRHPGVRESIVVAINRPGVGTLGPTTRKETLEKELIAYLVYTDQKPSVTELRKFLVRKLPSSMIPSVFVPLEALPLTANGKIDRKALSVPDQTPYQTNYFAAPRTELEELIAGVWREFLGAEDVGIHDNFFELGGHSLLAIRVLAKLRTTFQKELLLRDLFETPTVAELAKRVQALVVSVDNLNLPPVVRVARRRAYPVSLSQEQLLTLDRLLPGTYFSTLPYAYRFTGSLDIVVLRKSLAEIVKRHETLRTRFTERADQFVQVIGRVPKVKLPRIDLGHLKSEEVEREIAKLSAHDVTLPFDLELGPPFRFHLLQLSGQEHILLVTLHHIVGDHWSIQVFRKELVEFYEAFSCGHKISSSEASVQFVDFVVWQRTIWEKGLLKGQLDYWTKQLSGPVPRIEFQKRRKQRKQVSFRMSTQEIQIDGESLSDLRCLARTSNTTVFIVLTAVLDVVLYLYTTQRDLWIGTVVSNRGRQEIEDAIGYFINTVIIRTRLSPEMTFTQLLRQVKEATLQALANQDLPFGELTRSLAAYKGKGKERPLYQVMFNYRKLSFRAIELPGLKIAPLERKDRGDNADILLTTLDVIFDLTESSTALTGSVNYKYGVVPDHVVAGMIKEIYNILGRLTIALDEPIEQFKSTNASMMVEI